MKKRYRLKIVEPKELEQDIVVEVNLYEFEDAVVLSLKNNLPLKDVVALGDKAKELLGKHVLVVPEGTQVLELEEF